MGNPIVYNRDTRFETKNDTHKFTR